MVLPCKYIDVRYVCGSMFTRMYNSRKARSFFFVLRLAFVALARMAVRWGSIESMQLTCTSSKSAVFLTIWSRSNESPGRRQARGGLQRESSGQVRQHRCRHRQRENEHESF